MRVVFMGTPTFAVPSLEALAARHDVTAVVTAPDRPAGRGRVPQDSPVKAAALAAGLPVLQPATLRDESAQAAIAAAEPDVICVAAYGAILPKAVLDIPALGCVNVHASLLPRWRGAAPIERAILAGDAETGVSIMRMEEGLDTGPYALQVRMRIGEASAPELRESLGTLGAGALLTVLGSLEDGAVSWRAQDESEATYAAKVTPADTALEPELDVTSGSRRVRASGPSAPSRALVAGRALVVHAARRAVAEVAPAAGSIGVGPGGTLILGMADGGLELLSVTPAGKRRMTGAEFARGARIASGDAWGSAS